MRVWPCFSPGVSDGTKPAFYIAEARFAETGGKEYGLGNTSAKAMEICRGDCRARGVQSFPTDVENLPCFPPDEDLAIIHGNHWEGPPHAADPHKRNTIVYRCRLTSGACLTIKGLATLKEAQGAALSAAASGKAYRQAGHYHLGHEYNPNPTVDGATEL